MYAKEPGSVGQRQLGPLMLQRPAQRLAYPWETSEGGTGDPRLGTGDPRLRTAVTSESPPPTARGSLLPRLLPRVGAGRPPSAGLTPGCNSPEAVPCRGSDSTLVGEAGRGLSAASVA